MCGRYVLEGPVSRMLEFFNADFWKTDEPADWQDRFNIAPTSVVPVVRINKEGRRVLIPHRWGLIPSWAKDASVGARMNNARAETIAEKPSFRVPFRRFRCIVPASGYYEWQSVGQPESKIPKQPWFIRSASRPYLPMAGVCDHWASPEGETILSFSIVTTEAHPSIAHIHDRMPVMVEPADWQRWLDPSLRDAEVLKPLLKPSEGLEVFAVSRAVSATGTKRRDDRGLIDPIQA